MYILVGRGLGDAPSHTPWRVRSGMRPKLKALLKDIEGLYPASKTKS
jgi:hypothetical protein